MEKLEGMFIGNIKEHCEPYILEKYLKDNDYMIQVERTDFDEYKLVINSEKEEIYYFTRSEILFSDKEIRNHLKELISKMPDRLSCIAYITGYSKYNPDVEKEDLIYILQYILENK